MHGVTGRSATSKRDETPTVILGLRFCLHMAAQNNGYQIAGIAEHIDSDAILVHNILS